MTMRFLPNQLLTNGVNCELKYQVYAFKAFMTAASPTGPGWTVPRSSNGTTGGAGDNIASAADYGQAASWFVLQNPAGTKQWLFFHGSTSTQTQRILYSAGALFTGGDAANRATATDEQYIVGSAANAEVTFTLNTTQYCNFMADDAAPYGFAAWGWSTASSGVTIQWGYVYDPMISGTYDVSDTDPFVCFCAYSNTNTAFDYNYLSGVTNTAAYNDHYPRCWLKYSTGAWNNIAAQYYMDVAGQITVPARVPASLFTTKDQVIPISWLRSNFVSAPGGWKGVGSLMMWMGLDRSNGSTLENKTRICIGHISLPWDGSTTPLIA